jgi:hypothetical protein
MDPEYPNWVFADSPRALTLADTGRDLYSPARYEERDARLREDFNRRMAQANLPEGVDVPDRVPSRAPSGARAGEARRQAHAAELRSNAAETLTIAERLGYSGHNMSELRADVARRTGQNLPNDALREYLEEELHNERILEYDRQSRENPGFQENHERLVRDLGNRLGLPDPSIGGAIRVADAAGLDRLSSAPEIVPFLSGVSRRSESGELTDEDIAFLDAIAEEQVGPPPSLIRGVTVDRVPDPSVRRAPAPEQPYAPGPALFSYLTPEAR